MKAVLFVSDEFKDEALTLAETAGYEILDIYKLPKKPNSFFYIQEDRLAKIAESNNIDTIIIFDLLRPRHFINLNRKIPEKKVIDKLLLLLEIFALHAGSKEAKLQIELARLRYELPIIKDMYKKSKITEQQGPLGAGVYGVESTLRLYHRKISRISKELEHLKESREIQVQKTKNEGLPSIAIAGYTNAGKTSIFNALTGLSQKVDNSMFTTTSPKRYSIKVDSKKILLVDTVGFIRGIPPQIIEAFFVTLSEIKYASGILMVVDISLPDLTLIDMIKSSFNIIREIGVSGKPIIMVANKVDKVHDNTDVLRKLDIISKLSNELYFPIIDVISTSATKLYNIDVLRERTLKLLS
ncbi:GTPase HflX [Acidianus brierleyi]|uniref:GTPase HflX n=1 Tax=Acidianus brierleyi TaxID=41673 RepID=A0A2U9IEH2_9CREN|nr:GTPase HflX [Acidianus brierleyi]AWR94442.1 GTPase HflX [Acidianus brierleyi]